MSREKVVFCIFKNNIHQAPTVTICCKYSDASISPQLCGFGGALTLQVVSSWKTLGKLLDTLSCFRGKHGHQVTLHVQKQICKLFLGLVRLIALSGHRLSCSSIDGRAYFSASLCFRLQALSLTETDRVITFVVPDFQRPSRN